MISKIKIYNEKGKLIEVVNVSNPFSLLNQKYRLKNKSFDLTEADRTFIKKTLEGINVNSNIGNIKISTH